MNFRAVLFDLDGTLVDSLRDLHQAVNHVLNRYGRRPLDLRAVQTYIGDGVRVLLARSFLGWDGPAGGAALVETAASGRQQRGDLEESERARQEAIRNLLSRATELTDPTLDEGIDAFREFYGHHLTDHTRCYPGVEETLAELCERGVRMGVVSNKPEGYTAKILATLGLDRFIPVVVGGDSLPVQKPDPGPLLHALERLGASPAESLMVGDSVNDILSGRSAGCRTAIVTYGLGEGSLLRAHGPDLELDDIRELLAPITRHPAPGGDRG